LKADAKKQEDKKRKGKGGMRVENQEVKEK
jgi:hypothetical protein